MGFQPVTKNTDHEAGHGKEHRDDGGDIQGLDTGRNAHGNAHEDEQRIKGVGQRPSELYPRDNARKTERQGQAVLHDDDNTGNDTRQDQGCLVQGVIVLTTAVYGPVDPGHREHE